ncbi:hypothetical protein ACIQ6Y_31345 [Streptomyces sp. NPDC096205]|uniref:LppU/SCO3897 family protein n=1 Tax=Streptomyces sp. NPDC096205 TaxID=3366081 RepID=UPI0038204356
MSQNPQQPRPGGCLAVVAVIGAIVLGVGLFSQANDDDSDNSADSSVTSSPYDTYDPYDPSTETPDPYTSDPYETEDPYETDDPYETEDPYDSGDYGSEPTESEEPDPYTAGTCLNGQLPDSTTAQEVSVDEVDCSASDAHYQVIETIPFTSDMTRCQSNPRTEYAYNYRYTLNGTTINEYVYCLIGLGAYAR